MDKTVSNKKLIFLIVIIFALLVFIRFFKVCLLMFDDAEYASLIIPYETHTIIKNFIINTTNEHHQLLAVFLTKFFGFILPKTLGFHPQDFIMVYGHLIKGVFYLLSILSMTLFVMPHKKNNLLIISCVFLFLFFSEIVIIMLSAPCTFALYSAVFRFQNPFIYLFLFFHFVYKDYENGTFNHKGILTALFLLNILDGNEITIYSMVLFVVFLCFFDIIQSQSNKVFSFIKSHKFLALAFFLLPILKFLIEIKTFRYSSGLLQTNLLFGFLNKLICFLFIENIVITGLFIAIYFIYFIKAKEVKTLNIVNAIVISIILFLFSLIFYGKVDFFTNGNPVYLIEHWHVKAVYNIVIFIVTIFLSLQICEKYQSIKKFFIILMICVSIGILSYMYKDEKKNWLITFPEGGLHYYGRKELYKFDKTYLALLYTYNGKVYLSKEPKPVIEYYNREYVHFFYYISAMYSIPPETYMYISSDKKTADEKLKGTGITFSDDELNHPIFKKLYNKNFVLGS